MKNWFCPVFFWENVIANAHIYGIFFPEYRMHTKMHQAFFINKPKMNSKLRNQNSS